MEIVDKHREITELSITNTGNNDLILGTDWLRAHNPTIDWKGNSLVLNRCPSTCGSATSKQITTIGNLEILPIHQDFWEKHIDDNLYEGYDGIDAEQSIQHHHERTCVDLQRTTVSTNLAIAKPKETTTIPTEY